MRKAVILSSVFVLFLMQLTIKGKLDELPETWDIDALKASHLPPPDTSIKVMYAPKEYYDSLPEHVIYKTYPVYYREFEREGYIDSLRQLKPEVVFDPAILKSKEDWIKAGEIVFNWPVAYTSFTDKVSRVEAKGSSGKIPKDGAYLFSRYVLDGSGKLVVGSLSCASCHTRVLESGKIIPGAPGNIFNNKGFVNSVLSGRIPFPLLQDGLTRLSFAPWAPKEMKHTASTAQEYADFILAAPIGVMDRQGVPYMYPVMTPSLIGIQDIKYLDRTGLMKHDGAGDLMRYAALNQGLDMLTAYNGYIPGGKNNQQLPPPNEWNHPFGYAGKKYTDAQLYAMAQYIYSLQPVENPERGPAELIAKGNDVFNKAGCVTCHTPPLYTNNKLTPASGFEPPPDHFRKYDIFNISVETDSVSTLYSRRGTGYYKVPSLRGLWMQSAFFHNGNLASLEEVFDGKRLEPDYIPGGFKPPHLKTMAVKGHPFGLELGDADKEALIAFLKTL